MNKIINTFLVSFLILGTTSTISASTEQNSELIEKSHEPILVLEIENLNESSYVSQLEDFGYEITKTNTSRKQSGRAGITESDYTVSKNFTLSGVIASQPASGKHKLDTRIITTADGQKGFIEIYNNYLEMNNGYDYNITGSEYASLINGGYGVDFRIPVQLEISLDYSVSLSAGSIWSFGGSVGSSYIYRSKTQVIKNTFTFPMV